MVGGRCQLCGACFCVFDLPLFPVAFLIDLDESWRFVWLANERGGGNGAARWSSPMSRASRWWCSAHPTQPNPTISARECVRAQARCGPHRSGNLQNFAKFSLSLCWPQSGASRERPQPGQLERAHLYGGERSHTGKGPLEHTHTHTHTSEYRSRAKRQQTRERDGPDDSIKSMPFEAIFPTRTRRLDIKISVLASRC